MPVYRVSVYCKSEDILEMIVDSLTRLDSKGDVCSLSSNEWLVDTDSDINLYALLTKDIPSNDVKYNVVVFISEVIEDAHIRIKEYLVSDTFDESYNHKFLLRVNTWLVKHPCRKILLQHAQSEESVPQ